MTGVKMLTGSRPGLTAPRHPWTSGVVATRLSPMALPADIDVGVAMATSGIAALLEARLRLGRHDPSAPGAIDPDAPSLASFGYRIETIDFVGAPNLGARECWLLLGVSGPDGGVGEFSIGLTLTLATDDDLDTTLRLAFREARADEVAWGRDDLGELIDEIEASPLLDVSSLLVDVESALGVTLPSTTGVTTGLLAGDDDAEPAIAVFVSTSGVSTFPEDAMSFVHAGRHLAIALGGPFIETTVVPAALEAELGPMPAELEHGMELRSFTVTVADGELHVEGRASHDAAQLHTSALFGGPVHIRYSQPAQRVVVDVDDVDASLPISWLLLLFGPIGLFLTILIDEAIDAAVRSAMLAATAGVLGGFDAASFSAGGGVRSEAVLRWVEVESGSLVIGLSLHTGPRAAHVVAVSGTRRVERVQLDDDDVLAIADIVRLLDAGVVEVPNVHVVRSATTSRAWLRADPDHSTGNNLRSLPPVDRGLIPSAER